MHAHSSVNQFAFAKAIWYTMIVQMNVFGPINVRHCMCWRNAWLTMLAGRLIKMNVNTEVEVEVALKVAHRVAAVPAVMQAVVETAERTEGCWRELEYFENIGKFGEFWRNLGDLKKFGGIWTIFDIFEGIWRILEEFGEFCRNLNDFGDFWSISKCFAILIQKPF